MNRPIFEIWDNGINIEIGPEEYAALWGCDPCYDKPPRNQGDGYLFYNFGSEKCEKNKQWYLEFAAAIDRTLKGWLNDREKDTDDLTRLKEWVMFLANETETHR